MADIRHRVGIAAPLTAIYEKLTTTEGLAGWWAGKVDGDPALGGRLRFFFGGENPSAVMEVVDLTPSGCVGWRCVEGPAEWVGTSVTFDLKQDGTAGETVLLFTHAGWREPVEFMHHCSTKWAYFLLISLKRWLEGGEATPYPKDLKASNWG